MLYERRVIFSHVTCTALRTLVAERRGVRSTAFACAQNREISQLVRKPWEKGYKPVFAEEDNGYVKRRIGVEAVRKRHRKSNTDQAEKKRREKMKKAEQISRPFAFQVSFSHLRLRRSNRCTRSFHRK